MKLTNVTAQRLLNGMRMIDADVSTKLDGEVRLKLAINIERVMPIVMACQKVVEKLEHERAAARVGTLAQNINGEASLAVQNLGAIEQQIRAVSDSVEEYKLKKLELDDLKLKDNKAIRADTIASLAPILKKFDDGESDE